MKKYLLLGWMIGILLCMSACQSAKVPQQEDMPAHEGQWDWGITVTATDVRPNGMTLIFTQAGGNVTGELHTGSYFVVEKFVRGQWKEVEWQTEIWGWNDLAYRIPLEGTREMEVDWTELYGAVPSGSYRVGKEITDFRGPGDYDKDMYYLYFFFAPLE